MIDLKKIKPTTVPAKVELLLCSNWTYFINEDCVITFNYTRVPDEATIKRLSTLIEEKEISYQSMLEEWVDVWLLNKEINKLRNDLQYEQQTVRIGKYKCNIKDEQNLPDRLALARSANSDSVWSVAKATGLDMDNGCNAEGKDYTWEWKKA